MNRVLPEVTLDRIYGVQARSVCCIFASRQKRMVPTAADLRRMCAPLTSTGSWTAASCTVKYDCDGFGAGTVGATNAQGYTVKRTPAACTPGARCMRYGSSSATGQVSARFYITYTNGIMTKTYLSEVCTYDYDEA